jgi:pimeloyl-ACP methyl ester carboxylesterase
MPASDISPALPAKGYVDAAGLPTYYEVEGSGEPVLLLHGGFSTIESWAAQRSALAEHYQVWLPERRGHGRTRDVEGPFTYDNMAADTVAFMEAAGTSSSHIVGWSDGGSVGLSLALRRPDLVRKLVCIGTPANLDGLGSEFRNDADAMSLEGLSPALSEPYQALSPDGPDHLPVVFAKIKHLWRTEPRMKLDELRLIPSPTLLMLGDRDIVTIEHAATMAAHMPDAQLAVVPGTDHLLVFQKPDLVNRLILDFLAEKPAELAGFN